MNNDYASRAQRAMAEDHYGEDHSITAKLKAFFAALMALLTPAK